MNGHFAAVGDGLTAEHYEHGIQVIDEDKSFTFVSHHPEGIRACRPGHTSGS